MKNKTKAAVYTMFISVLNFILITIFNLIYNNCLIYMYGSSINGLISTLTQFVSLFTIIEGGFTTASVVATYEPIQNMDHKKLNDILYTTKRVYMTIGSIITIFVLVFGSIYIRFIDSPFSYLQTYSLLIITVLTTAFSLCMLSKYSVILQGQNKEYIFIFFSLLSRTITWIISIVLILRAVNITIVYSINIANILINTALCKAYERKNFPYVTYSGEFNKKLIPGTKDVLFQKIASTFFSSTDLILISVFINLDSASVYNLYYQIFKSVLNLLGSIAHAPFNSFGLLAKEDKSKLYEYFNIYQQLILLTSTFLLTVAGIMIIPFVRVYTKNIYDCNYIYPSLAFLFFSQIFAQIINRPYGTILNATGNFKMQNIQCGVAAIVNIVVSVSFIKMWGINSIIFGSFVGTLIILVMNIYQAYRKVFYRSVFQCLKNIIVNYAVSMTLIYISLKMAVQPNNYFQLLLVAAIVAILSGMTVLIVNIIADTHNTMAVIKYLMNKIQRG